MIGNFYIEDFRKYAKHTSHLLHWYSKGVTTSLKVECYTRDPIISCCYGVSRRWIYLFSLCPRQQLGYIADGSQGWRLTVYVLHTHETERGDHDSCLGRSHYTDTDQTSRERTATAGIEPRTSSPGVARSKLSYPPPSSLRERDAGLWLLEESVDPTITPAMAISVCIGLFT